MFPPGHPTAIISLLSAIRYCGRKMKERIEGSSPKHKAASRNGLSRRYSLLLHPHDSRMTSDTGSTVLIPDGEESPLILCMRSRTDTRPSSAAGWRTAVIGGVIRV